MKFVPAQHLRDYDFSDMERQLKEIFYLILFKPTLAVIDDYNPQAEKVIQLRNAAEDPLRDALATGRIQYADGVFSGNFSAAISGGLRSIGAKFDKRAKTYRLDVGRVPAWVKGEAANYQSKARQAHIMLKQKLNEIQENLNRSVNFYTVNADKTIDRIEGGFAPIARELTVTPSLSEDSKAKLSSDYTENMKLWIKKFAEEQTQDLRSLVEKNATEGYRFDKLIGSIKRRYGVTANKAKFLARQETGLFMSKYRKERFQEAGVRRYKWSTSHDARVRHDHRELDGTVWQYSQPPVVDKFTARRANPGEDYNCRCVDIPILEAAV